MRETRQSGSEGGARFKPSSLPLSLPLWGEVARTVPVSIPQKLNPRDTLGSAGRFALPGLERVRGKGGANSPGERGGAISSVFEPAFLLPGVCWWCWFPGQARVAPGQVPAPAPGQAPARWRMGKFFPERMPSG